MQDCSASVQLVSCLGEDRTIVFLGELAFELVQLKWHLGASKVGDAIVKALGDFLCYRCMGKIVESGSA